MLSGGLCHLLPDAISEIQPSFDIKDCTKVRIKGFPMGTFLCGLGLVLTLITDQIAQAAMSRYGVSHNHSHGHNRHCDSVSAMESVRGDHTEGEEDV